MATKVTKPPVFVLSGPSGSGKSTFLKMLFESHPNKFGFSVSHTTRKIRPNEENGIDYYFTDRETIQQEISEGKFLEHAEFAGNIYGTSRRAVQSVLDSNRICILDVDLEGVKNIRAVQPSLDATFILILPPSIEVLEKRLRDRGTETEKTISDRLQRAKIDMAFVKFPEGKQLFDIVIRNEDLELAYNELEKHILPSIDKK